MTTTSPAMELLKRIIAENPDASDEERFRLFYEAARRDPEISNAVYREVFADLRGKRVH